MLESTIYLLENYKKTYEIYNAIDKMEENVLSKFDQAIRSSFNDWLKDDWICTEDETLQDDYCINLIRNEWSFLNDKDDTLSYIWTYLHLEGDDPIWSFLGLPTEEEVGRTYIRIWLSDEFKKLPGFQKLIEKFDERNQSLLTDAGFLKKGGKVNRIYEMPFSVSNEALLKGLLNDNWDEALEPIKCAWQTIEKIDYKFLNQLIKQRK